MFKIELNSIVWNMSAIVLPILPTRDLILGMNFFESFDPVIDWKNKTVQLDPSRFSFPSNSSDMIIASFHVSPPPTSTTNIRIVPTPITLVQPQTVDTNQQTSVKVKPNTKHDTQQTHNPIAHVRSSLHNDSKLLLPCSTGTPNSKPPLKKISPTNSKYRMQGINSNGNSNQPDTHLTPTVHPPDTHLTPTVHPPDTHLTPTVHPPYTHRQYSLKPL
jgi:hypothetical protein